MKWLRNTAILILVSIISASASAQSATLAEVKAKYLNQRVIIKEAGGALAGPILFGWEYADPKQVKKGRFQKTDRNLPKSFLGKEATVIEIRFGAYLPGTPPESEKTNALGEKVSPDSRPVRNELIEYAVRFDDGTVAIGQEAYMEAIALLRHVDVYLTNLELSSEKNARDTIITGKLPSVIGSDLYIPVGLSSSRWTRRLMSLQIPEIAHTREWAACTCPFLSQSRS